ncbi:hypothetical protein RO3G_08032 [Rhizopus delemar RA 99-880]|uniref:Uncharacterized protein n=1 Tax=Rhizopus delemar (strain RA 99-880 / ATCC MYA-4621 / FGSC 9543 / NRRL 43880) TaxID=246409 RepID=I1C4E7_RHIO9|nr:hypothetical protein RO3G_08032 [Rhizopus delemar RA 99-880]|eukprot:EIE83327.1 hypothetical protein RO3G_08032 [Rhizopus delemar RA 99-880]
MNSNGFKSIPYANHKVNGILYAPMPMEIVLCMTVELVDYSGSDYLLKIDL